MKYEQVIGFLKEVEKFKTCARTCKTTDTDRAESDAEHSWHLAIFIMLLEGNFSDIDFAKLLKLALIHDLPEIYAGDTNPYRGNTEKKEENEINGAKKLFTHLPAKIETQFLALFHEYVEQKSIESKIVKSADKLMPLIQNLCTNESHSSYRKLGVTYQEVKGYMDKYFQSDDILSSYYLKLLWEANVKGVFHDQEKEA